MKKVAIRFHIDQYDDVKSIAQQIQRFIVEDDYKISTIIKKIEGSERIELDVGMEEKMPEFTEVVAGFDEDEIAYELYKPINGNWDKCELDDLELDRTPQWIVTLIALNLLLYFIMSCVQFFAIYDFYDEGYDFHGIFIAIGALITSLIPIVGSWVAYLGATALWQWDGLIAFVAFFAYYLPLLGFFFYLGWIVLKSLYSDHWYRFWRSDFN